MITFNKMGSYGRFGNQLFQYATLYSVAKTIGSDFGVPYFRKSTNEYNTFILDECFSNLSAKLSSGIIPRNYFEEKEFSYNRSIFGIPFDTDICGYFQSEKYFKDYKNDIKKEFIFSTHIEEKANKIKNQYDEEIISLHIRLGDYVNQQQNHPVCSIEYYEKALKDLPKNLPIFIFSDDNILAEKIFSSLNKNIIFPKTENKYIDMCLMTKLNYHIIANSSFSWWGAWLSNSKQVIAPSQWFGDAPHMPKNWSDIYCKDWIVL